MDHLAPYQRYDVVHLHLTPPVTTCNVPPPPPLAMSTPSQVTLYLLTLNCARLIQPPTHLASQLVPTLPTTQPPTLFILSLQEFAPLSPSFLGGTQITPYIASIAEGIAAATTEVYGLSYELLGFYNIGLVAAVVFVHPFAAAAGHVDSVQWAGTGLGIGGLGNKGAVALRLRVGGRTQVTAVATHWAPHEWAAEQRDRDWKTLVQNLVFDDGSQIYPSPLADGGAACLFVMGDLNYRTAETRPAGTEFPTAANEGGGQPGEERGFVEKWGKLWENDQLNRRKREGKTLHHLQEAEVDFPPTYKFAGGGGGYAGSRWPSWTDRILWLPVHESRVLRYDSIRGYKTSDHKPVFAIVEIENRTGESDGQNGQQREWKAPWGVSEGWSRRRVVARQGEVVVGTLWMAGLPGVVFTVLMLVLGGVWAWKGF